MAEGVFDRRPDEDQAFEATPSHVPPRAPTQRVLALQRAAGNRATRKLLRVPLGGVIWDPRWVFEAVERAMRRHLVFIMGPTSDAFYQVAERYWRAHLPNATFVLDRRSLHGVLEWIRSNLDEPAGDIYIVSHANEDGTLSFKLRDSDADDLLDVRELRDALRPSSGQSTLPQLTTQVDSRTRIHIKGCDIGRTQEMVELLDEAFNGLGVVTAPTHEQEYGFDPTLAAAGRRRFRDEVEASHPMPPPVSSDLTGADRARARRERTRLLAERRRAIATELTARRAEEDTAAELAGTYEAFSGPMFQRPGTQLFTAAELGPQIARLYGHLSDQARTRLAQQLTAPDRRNEAQAAARGTRGQRGQRVYRVRPEAVTFPEPRTVAEANRVLTFPAGFRARAVRSRRDPAAGGFTVVTEVDGTIHERGQDPREETFTFESEAVAEDAVLIRDGRTRLNNPDRYAWRVEEVRSNGSTTRRAVAERVVAYLHHGELDRTPHEHFIRPESDPDFFATSTFSPPQPAGGTAGQARPATVP